MESSGTTRQATSAQRLPWWKRLQLVWWMRGILGAAAVAGIIDDFRLLPPDWLRVVHAIGARWNEWVNFIAEWVSIHLPWGLELRAGGLTVFALSSVFLYPALASAASHFHGGKRRVFILAAIVLPIAQLVLATTITDNIIIAIVPLLIAAWLLADAGTVVSSGWQKVVLQAGGAVALVVFCVAMFTGGLMAWSWVIFPGALAFALMNLSLLSRFYLRALWITVSFIGTLELLYLAPGLHDYVRPIIEWIDPGTGAAING